MILIYPEKLSSVAADSEDGSFPATYLQNDKPKRYWKSSGSNIGVLTAQVAANSDQIAVFNTNAVSAEIDIASGSETFSIDLSSPHTHNRLWQSYTEQTAVHTVTITLTAPVGEAVYAGCLKIGKGVSLVNPKYGLSESRRDFSIVKELNNGAYYIRKKDPVRKFDLSFLEDRAGDFYTFSAVADYYGPQPLAMLLVDGSADDHEWAIFGHILNPFSASHDYPDHTNAGFSIVEAV
jgi:hypothetical protein